MKVIYNQQVYNFDSGVPSFLLLLAAENFISGNIKL